MLDRIKKIFYKDTLKEEQEILNKKYEKEGLTDEVLEQQVALNKKRNELNIPDEEEFIYENFVQ